MYLLAPIIDTYHGTSNYYKSEHNFPYDEVIQKMMNISFLMNTLQLIFYFVKMRQVSSITFKSYLDFRENKIDYPFTFNILKLLRE